MQNSERRIYAVIVTYNGMKWIAKCLSSVLGSNVNINVVIVDNNSADETVKFIKNNYDERVFLIQSEVNLGFGKANNVGIKYSLEAGATHILLINQDVYLEPSTVSNLLQYDNGLHILSPMHYSSNAREIDENFEIYSLGGTSDFPQSFITTEFVNAAFWLIPVDIVKVIGGFNPLFFHYGEDNNFAHRLIYHGFDFLIIKDSSIIHDRNKYGNKQLFDKNFHSRKMLLNLLNINRGIFKNIGFLMIQFAKIFYYLLRGDLSNLRSLVEGLSFVFKNRTAIRQSRKAERFKKLNWI